MSLIALVGRVGIAGGGTSRSELVYDAPGRGALAAAGTPREWTEVLHCSYIDKTLAPYSALGRFHARGAGGSPQTKAMVLSTCERREWYTLCDPAGVEHATGHRVRSCTGTKAFIRLAAIAAGLESRIVGDAFIFHQVARARDALVPGEELWACTGRALDVASAARRRFGLAAAVDYPQLVLRLSEFAFGNSHDLTRVIVGSGMLARALASMPIRPLGEVVYVTRTPRRLAKKLRSVKHVEVLGPDEARDRLRCRTYGCILATSNVSGAYRDAVRSLVLSPGCRGVVDVCSEPVRDAVDTSSYLTLDHPMATELIAHSNSAVNARAEEARVWLSRAAFQ